MNEHAGSEGANFLKAFKATMGHEGGYVNDPDDAGTETYRGISRRYHPGWQGWPMIDISKISANFPENIKTGVHFGLDVLVDSFYKTVFWNRFLGDAIPDQAVANELFDTSVNMGIGRAVKFLQISINKLNRNQTIVNDMVEDGIMGATTLGGLNSILKTDGNTVLLKMMNVLQGMHYMNYMTKTPTQEKYARGWFDRVELVKSPPCF